MSETLTRPRPMALVHAPRQDHFVRLEPLAEPHKAALGAAAAADATIWRELYPISWDREHFEATWAEHQANAAGGRVLPFAVLAGGRVVGLTSYMSIEPAQHVVEIGGTWYAPDVRGTAVNPAAKRLMMGHAFDEAGARRVVFRVDALNLRSRAAVLKLSAVQEGVLRQDRVTWTGRIRDTVIFSVLATEWPNVRDRLDARLAAPG
jgi:RimJ/RimL family protein N-acetyltransferase